MFVNLSLHPIKYQGLTALGLVGSDDRSRSLGAGSGYVPGEGVGVVLLKPQSPGGNSRGATGCLTNART